MICRKKKIEIDLFGRDGKTNKKIELAINFNFGSIKSEGLDWKENDIVFATGSNLKWSTNFIPKAIFSAF